MELKTTEGNENMSPKGIILIYGQPKIGKSTLAAGLVDVVIDLEDGLGHLKGVKYYRPTTMKELKESINLAYRDFKSVCIDTLDVLNNWIEDEVCQELGTDEMGEAGYGSDWGKSRRKVLEFIHQLRNSFDLVVLVGHQKLAIVEESSKARHVDLPGKLSRYVTAQCDAIGFCEIQDGKRVINFAPYNDVDSGSRFPHLQGVIEFTQDSEQNKKNFNIKEQDENQDQKGRKEGLRAPAKGMVSSKSGKDGSPKEHTKQAKQGTA